MDTSDLDNYEIRTIRFLWWDIEGTAWFAVRTRNGDYASRISPEELLPILHSLRIVAETPRHPLWDVRYEVECANACENPFDDPKALNLPAPSYVRPTAPPDWALQVANELPYSLHP